MKNLKDMLSMYEGKGNNEKFGTPSTNGAFIDYFETPLKVGDSVAFLDKSFRDSSDFCKAKVSKLTTDKDGDDFAELTDIEYPGSFSKPVKKKVCDNLIKISK